MSDNILTKLEEAILKGDYPPGSRLLERALAEKLGVSRVPVREALQTLERWGLVNRLNQGGRIRVVAARKREDIISVYKLRGMLEAQALSLQALAEDLELLDTLQALVVRMDELIVMGDIDRYRKANAEFHFEIINAVSNQKMNEVYMDINRMIRWYQSKTLYKPRMKSSNQEHQKMLTAYQDKDLSTISILFMKHHDLAARIIIEGINDSGESDGFGYSRMKKELLRPI